VSFELREEQEIAFRHALQWFATATHGSKIVYSSPTGTGKSYIQLKVLEALPDAFLVVPRVEIQAGLLDKMGVEYASLSGLTPVAEAHRIYTPIRLRNELSRGTIQQPGKLIIDEGHHASSDTYEILEALCGSVPACAYTATPFRGTPKGTLAFRKGGATRFQSSLSAKQLERVSIGPSMPVVPLIDDDLVSVTNGEFNVTELDNVVGGVLPAVVEMAKAWFIIEKRPGGTRLWDRPTMFTVPTVQAARDLTALLITSGLPAYEVTGETNYTDRERSFAGCVAGKNAIVQVNVVSEGVDLPLRRLVDLRPTLSPVLWMQTLGRITRPVKEGEDAPEYICCNRNILRHAYLLDGCIPTPVICEAESAFAGPGNRMGLRVVGFEGLGRFKATELPLSDGTTGLMYAVSAIQGQVVTHYVLLSSPNKSEVLVAKRERAFGGNWDRSNKWTRVDGLPDLTGFASLPPHPLTEKARNWWKRSAGTRGLNGDAKVNARAFQALPVLFDIRGKMV
jgi:hypothetical protein